MFVSVFRFISIYFFLLTIFVNKNLYICGKDFGNLLNYTTYLSPSSLINGNFGKHRSLLSSSSSDILDTNTVFAEVNELIKGVNQVLKYEDWSVQHKFSNQVIFACGLSLTYIRKDAKFFAGTARKAGFQGDIVVAVRLGSNKEFLDGLKYYNVTVYSISLNCNEKKTEVNCNLMGEDLPISLIRYFIYQSWALKYPKTTYIMTSDLRDVFFQSNPFTIKNKYQDWGPSVYDLVLFNEPHPNRVISRCPRTAAFFVNCYGKIIYNQMGSSVISSNGVAFAHRDALIVYSYLITQQRLEINRKMVAVNFTSQNKRCYSFGVDLVYHNYLIYSGVLHKNFKMKVFAQGEGPVNTVGGFYGDSKILRASLSEWRIVRGDEKFKYVYNWNGEISSVVHQLDRFLNTEFQGGYRNHLAVFQHLDS